MTEFIERFKALTGLGPHPWQVRLYNSLINGVIPQHLHLPTGAGKTSVIPVWLCVIWQQLKGGSSLTVPRRLYSAIDRRVVVDQSEVVVQTIAENIKKTELWEADVAANLGMGGRSESPIFGRSFLL